jgi:flagellar hook-length control protein FliK
MRGRAIIPLQRSLVPHVTPEAVAVRHAQPGQSARSNFSSAQSTDQSSPFASLLDEASDPAPAPTGPAPTSAALPGQKPALRPQDGHATPASSHETAASSQESPSDGPAPGTQASDTPSSSNGPASGEGAPAALALVAASKTAAVDPKSAKDRYPTIDPNVVATSNSLADANADATARSSTAAAIIDTRGGKASESDSTAADTTPAATQPADPSANASGPVAPQPVAIPVSVAVIPAAPIAGGGASDGGTGQDAKSIAALGDAVKAGAPRADQANGDAPNGSTSTTGDRTGGIAKPGTKPADATPAVPTPQDELNSAAGADQRNSADAAKSRNADGIPAAGATANRARQLAASSQPTDGIAAPQDNSDSDPHLDPEVGAKQDLAGFTGRIEDIARQALDPTARRSETASGEAAGSDASHPGGVQADTAPQSPDGTGGLIAPATLTTSAAPTATAAANPTPTAIPIAGLAVEIASHAHAGKNRFEIRLDPPELGRIDVRLDVDREGKVTSHLVVDRPETLDILRRDAPALERSLQQAGLKTADDALQFSLRDQGGSGGQNPFSSNNGSPASPTRVLIPDRELPPVEAVTGSYSRVNGTGAGIDIRV